MAKPRLEKVRALFYVLQQLTKKRRLRQFDTASSFYYNLLAVPPTRIVYGSYTTAYPGSAGSHTEKELPQRRSSFSVIRTGFKPVTF